MYYQSMMMLYLHVLMLPAGAGVIQVNAGVILVGPDVTSRCWCYTSRRWCYLEVLVFPGWVLKGLELVEGVSRRDVASVDSLHGQVVHPQVLPVVLHKNGHRGSKSFFNNTIDRNSSSSMNSRCIVPEQQGRVM